MTTFPKMKTLFRNDCADGRRQRRVNRPIAAVALVVLVHVAHAQSTDPFLSETRLFAMSWCPNGWVMAGGQQMALQQNQALFSVVGTAYGGNGVQTFGVPDLRGRSPVGQGNGPGLQGNGSVGQLGGTEEVMLTITQLPAHNHQQIASTAPATHATPAAGRLLAQTQNGGLYAVNNGSAEVAMITGPSGGNARVPVRDPFLTMTWCTAVTGLYPSRP